MRPPSRHALTALVLTATLGLGATACTRADGPAEPAGPGGTTEPGESGPAGNTPASVGPESEGQRPDANTVPPGTGAPAAP